MGELKLYGTKAAFGEIMPRNFNSNHSSTYARCAGCARRRGEAKAAKARLEALV
jgi:hypothetical protein